MSMQQQSVCQKLAQITYDESLSSQSSSAGEEASTSFAWTGVDQHNLSRLFWDKEGGGDEKNRGNDHVSKRLINLLKI